MDCRIELNDGTVLNIPGVDESWTWFDLFDTLVGMGEISQNQFDELDEILDFDDPVQPTLSLKNNQLNTPSETSSNAVETVQRPLGNVTSDTAPVAPKTGLKRKSAVSASTPKSGLKQKSTPVPSPIPSPSVPSSGGLKRKIKSTQSSVVTNLTFSMPLKCSKDGADWTATLVSQHKPIKSQVNTSKTASKGKFGGSIHLVLDDSYSMEGDALRQLKSAGQSFLSDRPNKEHIVLHTLNRSLSDSGSPSKISSTLSRLDVVGDTPMRECLKRVKNSVSNSDVIIFFTDGGSTDGDPSSVVNSIKTKGARFISIGCGAGADENLLRKLASTKGDYHHAKSASGILQAFQAVAKSLGQQQIARSTSGSKSGSTVVARQVQSQGSVSGSSSGGGTMSGPSLMAADEGFEYIEEFKCHHCAATERIACGHCGKNMCSGGAKQPKSGAAMIRCPYCSEDSEIEITQKGVHAGVGRLGGKGKK